MYVPFQSDLVLGAGDQVFAVQLLRKIWCDCVILKKTVARDTAVSKK